MEVSNESCRFETSETLAAFVASTPLLSESWKLCNAANAEGNILTQHGGGIWYVALPAVNKLPSGEFVELEAAGEGLFSALRRTSAAGEPPQMVDSEMLSLFSSMFSLIHPQIMGCMEGRKLVLTGHSGGGAMASLTALWLLSYLQSLSSSSLHVLCITFGSPLLVNRSLSTVITRLRFNRNFCHVASTRDIVPRFLLSPHSPEIARLISSSLHLQNASSPEGSGRGEFWPFGSYLFCSEEGGVCIDDSELVCRMLVMLNARTTGALEMEDHLKYGNYVEILSQQFLKARSFNGGNVSESSYHAGVALAVEAMGISHEEPAAAEARGCIETARRISQAPILKSTEISNDLGRFLRCRLEIQWYKERCDASTEQLGYYDFFKRGTMRSNSRINMNRVKLAKFWDGVIEMIEKNELPFDFHLRAKWLYASQFYQLLAEPLDIAYFYKNRKPEERGNHYLMQGNRPKRYVAFDNWWRERPESHKKKYERTRYASSTQDTCFWAKLEEAIENLDDVRTETDGCKRSILWEKVVAFERYADELVRKKDVSIDVLARNSSYSKWVEALREFKSQMSPDSMETM
ncbi:PREDICTED: lipase-like PAD4 [Tarenaya hassleriana]|uniref:lipase-like PAD4 n=1 Tax=Tarenaya hassleriana TaxID=28532 RepID=UPI00053C96FD|nr:PREDICTED: lipase-like PAD4 [Tarenaya hassleriana]